MNWTGVRATTAVSAFLLGLLLGAFAPALLPLPGSFATVYFGVLLIPLPLCVMLIVTAVLFGRVRENGAVTIAARAEGIASGTLRSETTSALVWRVPMLARTGPVGTMLQSPTVAPARLVQFRVLPANSTARLAHALVPVHITLAKGMPAALLLDRAHPDLALLDDRATPETLAAVNADPRWTTTKFPSAFAHQGGRELLIGLAAGFVTAVIIALILNAAY
ncbi:hypothetical protein ACI3KT_13035 [Microbacterium sp. ZW T6_19]|uniref:hypothetical protein n=1 Tax=Microbacterium sp. ZW T6_19 TaxID=3378082 RepID=UPI00385552A2